MLIPIQIQCKGCKCTVEAVGYDKRRDMICSDAALAINRTNPLTVCSYCLDSGACACHTLSGTTFDYRVDIPGKKSIRPRVSTRPKPLPKVTQGYDEDGNFVTFQIVGGKGESD